MHTDHNCAVNAPVLCEKLRFEFMRAFVWDRVGKWCRIRVRDVGIGIGVELRLGDEEKSNPDRTLQPCVVELEYLPSPLLSKPILY